MPHQMKNATAMLSLVPDPWGPKRLSSLGGVSVTKAPAGSIRMTARADIALVMFTPQPKRTIALASDRRTSLFAPVGHLELVPAGADLFAKWGSHKENLFLALEPARVRNLVSADLGSDKFEWNGGPSATADESALVIARLIAAETSTSGRRKSQLYLDSLVTALTIHLLRRHSSIAQSHSSPIIIRGGLTPQLLRRVDEYMRSHLADNLSLTELAALCSLSAGHFLRAFRQSTGETPYRYLLLLRLRQATQLIATTRLSLRTIAEMTGFSSHSHLSSTMNRVLNYTPRQIERPKGMPEN